MNRQKIYKKKKNNKIRTVCRKLKYNMKTKWQNFNNKTRNFYKALKNYKLTKKNKKKSFGINNQKEQQI